MTVLARKVRSTPQRSAVDTWEFIVTLLAPLPGPMRDELLRVDGIASSIIASEAPANSPIVVGGIGPRVRIYCLFGDDAIAGDDASEQLLPKPRPDGSDWFLSLPCPEDDLTWVKTALINKSTHISARKVGDAVEVDDDGATNSGASVFINTEAFLRP